MLGEFRKQLTVGLECNDLGTERKNLDSREAQGLEQVLQHSVGHCKILSGEVA